MAKTKEEPTGLAIIPKDSFLGLASGNGDMRAALDSLAEAGESLGPGDLIRVPMPTGGGTTWEIPSLTGEPESAKEITGVLVYYQKCGILWPSEDFAEGSMPVLRSWDLVTAEQIGPIPDDMAAVMEPYRIDERHFRWDSLPYNQFGTGKEGNGKRCKEQRMLFLLRQGDVFPILVTCQPGSLKAVTGFIKRLPMSGIQYWQAVVSLGLEKTQNASGKPYSRIVPRLAGKLSAVDAATVKATWTEPLSRMVRQIEVVVQREPGEEG
jgi:hypothetical protein